jgi:hypothetical protein
MLREILVLFLLFPYFFCNYSLGSNIATRLLNDKKFLEHYGEIGRSLAIKIMAWVNVISNRNVTLAEMEHLFSMYIPKKKQFFIQLENIIFKVPLRKSGDEHERIKARRNQLIQRILQRKKKLYSARAWIWHIQEIRKNTKKTEEEDNLATKLLYALTKRSVLSVKLIEKLRKNKILNSIPQDPYPLLLRNINREKKIKKIQDNYQCSALFLNLCNSIRESTMGKQKPSVLINRYFPQSPNKQNIDKKTQELNLNKFYCTFILLVSYIQKNHKKENFSLGERDKIFDFLSGHEYFITKHFQGIGISSYFETMSILVRKIIHHPGTELKNSPNFHHRLKNFIKFGIENNDLRIIMALEDWVDPYYKYELPENLIENFEKKNGIKTSFFKAIKKVKNPRKLLCVHFFINMGIAAILLRDFTSGVIFLKSAFLFSKGMGKTQEEYIIYLIVFSLVKMIEQIKKNNIQNLPEEKVEENNQIEEIYGKIEFWIKIIKKIGQTTIYGQLLCDLFAQGYRKTSHLSTYANSFYHSIYKNTIKNKKWNQPTEESKSQNTAHTSKYDWLVFMGIYVLSKERTDINLEVHTDAQGKKQYTIYNNKYSISSAVNYKFDYIVKCFNKKSLLFPTVLMKELVLLSIKKHRYMLMLGEVIEEQTGVINALTIHPVTALIEPYCQDPAFDYRILSPIMRNESFFVMRMDQKDMNSHTGYNAVSGAGLFQINHSNARKSAKILKMAFSGAQLSEDIPYNFVIITTFIKEIQKWLRNKHVINFIIAYNAGYGALKRWYEILDLYNIPAGEPAFILVGLFLLHGGINKRYTNTLLSNYNKSIYWQSNSYVNVMLGDKRPFR